MTDAVEARACAALDRRLDAASDAPLAVAVSGGGDSVALLHLADGWARRVGRDLRVLTVDHGLHPESSAWAAFVTSTAERLGRPAEVLRWTGEKPLTGLPAAARAARHALLAQAARAAGAAVVLMGHTAGDVAEGALMRAEGSNLGRVREWGPSPAWPEGRGVFLLRPLLGVARAELRAWLQSRGHSWIEDPANNDTRFARTRARAALREGVEIDPTDPTEAARPALPLTDEGLAILSGSPRELRPHQLAAALVCTSGGMRAPRGAALDAVMERLRAGVPFTTTLAGARLLADGGEVVIGRERGRSGLSACAVAPAAAAVWDGRFEVNAPDPGAVRALAGSAARLGRGERAALKGVPAAFRPAMPVVETASGAVYCPLFTTPPQARSLVGERWLAACGAFTREQDVRAGMVNGAARAGVLSSLRSTAESVSG